MRFNTTLTVAALCLSAAACSEASDLSNPLQAIRPTDTSANQRSNSPTNTILPAESNRDAPVEPSNPGRLNLAQLRGLYNQVGVCISNAMRNIGRLAANPMAHHLLPAFIATTTTVILSDAIFSSPRLMDECQNIFQYSLLSNPIISFITLASITFSVAGHFIVWRSVDFATPDYIRGRNIMYITMLANSFLQTLVYRLFSHFDYSFIGFLQHWFSNGSQIATVISFASLALQLTYPLAFPVLDSVIDSITYWSAPRDNTPSESESTSSSSE